MEGEDCQIHFSLLHNYTAPRSALQLLLLMEEKHVAQLEGEQGPEQGPEQKQKSTEYSSANSWIANSEILSLTSY